MNSKQPLTLICKNNRYNYCNYNYHMIQIILTVHTKY